MTEEQFAQYIDSHTISSNELLIVILVTIPTVWIFITLIHWIFENTSQFGDECTLCEVLVNQFKSIIHLLQRLW